MNFIRSATSKIFGGGNTAADEANPADGQKIDPPACSEEDFLNQCMPEEMQEEMFCFTMGDCELFEIRANPNGTQTKKCEFINASIHIAQMPFSVEGAAFQMPCMIVTNDDYDADQEMKQEEKLPLAENLIFMRYEVTDEPDNIG